MVYSHILQEKPISLLFILDADLSFLLSSASEMTSKFAETSKILWMIAPSGIQWIPKNKIDNQIWVANWKGNLESFQVRKKTYQVLEEVSRGHQAHQTSNQPSKKCSP